MARRGLFPFPACVFWGLSDLTQARRGHPAACRALLYPTFAASPVPISSGSPSPAEQARPTFWGPPCSQWALETASGRGTMALCDPYADVGEDPRGSQSPHPRSRAPLTRRALQAQRPHLPPQAVCPSSGKASFPSPAFIPQSFPALPQTRKGGNFPRYLHFPWGTRSSSLWQEPPSRMSRSPILGAVLWVQFGHYRMIPVFRRQWSAPAGSPEGYRAHAGTNSQFSSCPTPPDHSHSPCPRPSSTAWAPFPEAARPLPLWPVGWFGLLWKVCQLARWRQAGG